MIKNKRCKILINFVLIVTFIISSTYISSAYSKDIQFKNITIEDGLSQSTVEVLFQDSKGYIWIGTNDGLNRYNGYDFKVYKRGEDPSTNIASNYILSIKEDNSGNIWVATVNGLSKINSKNDSITNYFDKEDQGNLSNYNVSDILITKKGSILVSTADGLNLYNQEKDSFRRILGNENDLTDQDIYSLDQDEYGNIWIGTYMGLNKIDIKEKNIEHFYSSEDKKSISEDHIYKVYSDKNGYIWVGTFNKGVNKISIKTNEINRYENIEGDKSSLSGNFVRNILRDNNNDIWICTESGLSKYTEENDTFESYKSNIYDRYSLLSDNTFSIIQDNSGLIWIGTYKGISIFDPNNNIENYKNEPFDKNSLSENIIHGIYEDEDGLLWVGTNSKGLNVLDRDKGRIEHIKKEDGLSNNSISFITGDGDYIWVGTRNGLNRINRHTKSIKKYNVEEGLSNFNIKSLLIDSKGYLWIGTSDGVNILNLNNDDIIDITPILEKNSINDKYIEYIYEDKEGDYWLGTFIDGGLIKIDVDNKHLINYRTEDDQVLNSKDHISSNSVRAIIEDEHGNIWVGTDYGLNKLDKSTEKFTTYTEKYGLPNNTIYGILIDMDENLWMSTNHGISKLDAVKNKFVNFNFTNGFQSNEFNGGAYYKTRKGEMLFGGINGLSIFDPVELKTTNYSPKVAFEEFQVKGERYKNIEGKKFNYDGNTISIKFFLPDYKDSDKVRYYYKVEGKDEQWSSTENNEVIYRNLEPGEYTFKIKARNHNGAMSEENSINFTIKPHILLSPVALLFYAIIVIIVIHLNLTKIKRLDILVDKRTRQLRNEMEKNNRLLSKIIKLERNKNNYFVNLSHELRTPLNVIYTTQQLILELNKKGNQLTEEKISYHIQVMRKNTDRLLNLINNIIDTSKIDHGNYKINLEEQDIVYIVEEVALGLKDYIENKKIDLIIDPDVEEKIVQCDRYEIERCIVNLLNNATKFTPEGGQIEIKLKDLEDTVLISVRDTGIGISQKHQKTIFDRFKQVNDEDSWRKGGSGLGLTITKNIVDMHKGKIFVESELGKGSTFSILLPSRIDKQ